MLPESLLWIAKLSVSATILLLGIIITTKLKTIYSKIGAPSFIVSILLALSVPVAVVRIQTNIQTTQTFINGYIGSIGILTFILLLTYAVVASGETAHDDQPNSKDNPYTSKSN